MRLKHKISIILVLGLVLAGVVTVFYLSYVNYSYGVGKITSEVREVSDIESIEFSSFGNLFITQSNVESLTIESPENLLSELHTYINNGTLIIKHNQKYTWPRFIYGTVNYYLAVKDLSKIKLTGSGRIRADQFNTDELLLEHVSSGELNMFISAKRLNVKQSGSGNIGLIGDVDIFDIDHSGSGKLESMELSSKNTRIINSGSGYAQVYDADKLIVDIRGSGDVFYKKNGSMVELHDTGSGNLIRIN